jgi:hypothetical protein
MKRRRIDRNSRRLENGRSRALRIQEDPMKPSHRLLSLTLCLVALAAGTGSASAQMEHQAGGYFVGSFPTGDWGQIAGFGLALDGTDIVRFGPEKPLQWRVSSGLLYNFSRTVSVPSSNLLPTSQLDLETKNWSLVFGLGPELAKRGGSVVPFVYGVAGFDTYWTSSELFGTAAGLPYSVEHGDSRISFAWAAGGGFRRRVTGGYMAELSVEYRSGLEHHFVLPEQVREDATGVHADRASRQSDQILVRLGTVIAD